MNHLSPCEVLAASLSPPSLVNCSGHEQLSTPHCGCQSRYVAIPKEKPLGLFSTVGDSAHLWAETERGFHTHCKRNHTDATWTSRKEKLLVAPIKYHKTKLRWQRTTTSFCFLFYPRKRISQTSLTCAAVASLLIPPLRAVSHSQFTTLMNALEEGQYLPELWDLPLIQPEVWQSRVKTKFFHLTVTIDFCSRLF